MHQPGNPDVLDLPGPIEIAKDAVAGDVLVDVIVACADSRVGAETRERLLAHRRTKDLVYRFAQEIEPATVSGMEREDLKAFVKVARLLGVSLSTTLAVAAASDEEEMAARPPAQRWRRPTTPEHSNPARASVARQVTR